MNGFLPCAMKTAPQCSVKCLVCAQHLDVQVQTHRFDNFFSVFEAGRGNDLFLSANIRQNNQCALLTEKVNQLLSSFIAFSFSFFFFF